ncbi:STY0301 family protein [Massilia aurea]|uniref:STY0301 family protein n=1 Tax=Massilia aurea TaxID=373040 RepID=UPI0034629320
MRFRDAVFFPLFGVILQAVADAAPKAYVCPKSISEAALHVLAPGEEWKPFVSSPLYLSGAAPADGPPARLGILREDTATKTKAGWSRRYSLDGRYPEGKWLRCDYGSLGEVSMAKRLPDDTQSCTVKGKQGEHVGEAQIEVHCL